MLLFAGIDPGTTSAYYLIDLDGNIVDVASSRELFPDILLRRLAEKGNIAVVATDKARAPYLVRSIATKLGAIIFTPRLDIPIKEKMSLTRKLNLRNSHERDACAAALFAHAAYRKRIAEIDRFLALHDAKNIRDEFIEKAIRQKHLSYNSILDSLDKEKCGTAAEEGKPVPKKEADEPLTRDLIKLRSNIKSMARHNKLLLSENAALRSEIARVSSRLEKLNAIYAAGKTGAGKSEKELMKIIEFKERRLQSLQEVLRRKDDSVKHLQDMLSRITKYASRPEEYMFVEHIRDLTSVVSLNPEKERIIFVDNVNVFSEKAIRLCHDKELILITQIKPSQKLKSLAYLTIIEWDAFSDVIDGKAVIRVQDLNSRLKRATTFTRIVEEYKEARKKELSE